MSALNEAKGDTRDETKARLRGIFNITVTPFAADGTIDFRGLAESVERLIAMRFDGFLIGGTYGEFATMSVDERATLFHRTVDIVGSRLPVLLCSAHSDPRMALHLTELATELGGIPMVTPPFVSEVTDDQVVAFFRTLAPASQRGLVIYNAPGIGITLSPRLIERIGEMEHIVGLKQGDLTPTSIDELAGRLGGRIRLFCASDLAFLGPLIAGFDGLSSTNSCALPEIILATYRAVEAGDARAAKDLHRNWFGYRDLARRFGQPQTVKAAMNLRGWAGGTVRAPLLPLTEMQTDELRSALASFVPAAHETRLARA